MKMFILLAFLCIGFLLLAKIAGDYAGELENSNSCDFERFEAVLDNDNQHYYVENNYGRTF